MDMIERDITSVRLNDLPSIRNIEGHKKNMESEWEEIELRVISSIPTAVEFDISDLKNDEVISVSEGDTLVIGEPKKDKVFSTRDVLKLGVASMEILLSLPALPVMITADYFSKEFGQKVKKVCYSYREKLYNLSNKIV